MATVGGCAAAASEPGAASGFVGKIRDANCIILAYQHGLTTVA